MSSSLSRRTALQAAGAVAVGSMVSGVGGTAQAAAAKTGSTGDIVVVHPTLPQVPVNNSFTVKVRPLGGTWQRLDVYLAKLALIDAVTGRNPVQNSSWASFDFSGTVEVEVTYNPG
ncbi:endo-polygalacturonase, partial [Streptomyces sp. TRM72054]|nr:endo-polygalacturonase [Streptomyces sp. TRM72054]